MTEALVVTAAGLQLCLERADEGWLDSLSCPEDGSWGALSISKGKISFIIAREDKSNSSRAVVLAQNGDVFGQAPPQARREILQRIHRVLMAAQTPPLRLPLGWNVFQHENLIAFFACRREFGAWRWIAEVYPRGSHDTGFWRLTHSDSQLQLEQFPESPYFTRASETYNRAASAWGDVVADANVRFRDIPAEKGPKKIAPAIDLDITTFGAVTKHLTYSAWLEHLTPRQREFLDHPSERSVKLRGPAGSGKTLALELKALRELYRALDAGRVVRLLFATHSWSAAEQVDASIRLLDERGESDKIDVYPLLEIARERLPREHAHGALGLLGHDSLSGRRLQLERIDAIVSRLRRGDWIAYRERVSPEFRRRVEAESGSPERNTFVWDLMMEFSSVLGAQGIFPGVTAERRYLALSRMAWMMPLPTAEERRFVLRVYTDYVDELRAEGVLTADQLVNDFLSYLETFTWNARRASEGYDLILVDELHLFSEQERLILNYLTRSADEYPRIIMALDPRQAPSEAYGYSGVPSARRESGEAEAQLGEVRSLDLRVIHRFAVEILDLVRHVHQSYPALDLGADWAFDPGSLESSAGSAGTKPTISVCVGLKEEREAVLARAAAILNKTDPDERVAVILLDPLRLEDYEKSAVAFLKTGVAIIKGKDDVDRLRYTRRSVVLSAAEYVAGLQFSHVIVAGFPHAETRGANSSYQLRRLLSSLYLAVSRASKVVEIYTNSEAGELLDVLETAMRMRIIAGAASS